MSNRLLIAFLTIVCVFGFLFKDNLFTNDDTIYKSLINQSEIEPSMLENTDPTLLAKNLVFRLHELKEQTKKENFFDYKDSSKIYMSFNSKHLKSILTDGRFKNAHEVTQGATYLDPLKLRAEAEDTFLKIKLGSSDRANLIRPKYAFLQLENASMYPPTKYALGYGNIFAKILDKVKDRSTFSLGDSLDRGANSINTFHTKHKIDSAVNKHTYWETQIWGPLTLDEVEYFLVQCEGFPKLSINAINLLLSFKKPVYYCNLSDNRTRLSRGKQILSGNLSPQDFLNKDDIESPLFIQISIRKDKNNIYIKTILEDDNGSQYCLAKGFSKNDLIHYGDDIQASGINEKHLTCKFQIPSNKNIDTIEIYGSDWYGNRVSKIFHSQDIKD